MQTVQFKVDNDYINIVLTILNNLKNDIVKDISIFREDSVNRNNQNSSFPSFPQSWWDTNIRIAIN